MVAIITVIMVKIIIQIIIRGGFLGLYQLWGWWMIGWLCSRPVGIWIIRRLGLGIVCLGFCRRVGITLGSSIGGRCRLVRLNLKTVTIVIVNQIPAILIFEISWVEIITTRMEQNRGIIIFQKSTSEIQELRRPKQIQIPTITNVPPVQVY